MRLDRLEVILQDWAKWMKIDNHGLGYPNKSTMLLSGGESSHEVFEHMIEAIDNKNVATVDACIDSLPTNQKRAVYAHHLRLKKDKFHERDYSLALDNLLTIVGRRIFV
jgi:hypothetical protein